MTLETSRKWLVGIWGVGFVIPLLLIFIQDINGKYGDKGSETLGWLTSLTLPTILLMIGVMVTNPSPTADRKTIEDKPHEELTDEEKKELEDSKNNEAKEKFVFKLAVGISVVYLFIINMFFFYEPLTTSTPHELMGKYKIYLALFDSALSLVIGSFFARK